MTNAYQRASARAFLLGGSLMAIAYASPAWAQAANAPSTADQTAQTPQAADQASTGNQEIIVTAQFTAQRLQDTPLAITAVTAQQLEAKSQTDLATVADAAPNVQIRPQTGAYGPSVTASIRGIGQNDFNPAYEPGVGIYIDDVYYPSLTGAIFDTLDLDRVEILRGPQGTLSGRNSIGGAVKMYSRMPDGSNSGFVEASYGSRNKMSLRAAADFALTKTIFVRVSGVSKRQDGYIDQLDFGCVYPAGGPATFVDYQGHTVPVNPAGGEQAHVSRSNCLVGKLGGVNYQAGRAIVRFEPSSSFNYTVIGDYTDQNNTGSGQVIVATKRNANPNVLSPGGLPVDDRFICGKFCNFQVDGNAAGNPFVATIPGDPFHAGGTPLLATQGSNREKYRGWGVSGQGNLDLTDSVKLTSITGYREFDTTFYNDGDLSPARTGFGINYLSNWSFSQEVRLNWKPIDAVLLTVGGYYFKQASVYDSVQDLRYVAPYPLQFRQPDHIKADAKALFANLGWEILPNLNFNGGIRYTKESKDQTYFRYNLDGTINAFLDPVGAAYGSGYDGPDTKDSNHNGNTTEVVKALTGQTAEYRGHKIDWRVALDYRFNDEVMVYGSVATGFKGGGSNPRPFNAFQLLPFAPETLTAYEVGMKTDLFDRKLRVDVSAFLNKYANIQTGVRNCPTADPIYATPSACRINSGNADIKGLELEMTARPVTGLQIDGSLSYLDFKYTYVNPLSGALLSDPGTGMPKWKANIGAQYEADLGEGGTITPRVDVYYQDKTFAGINNTDPLNRLVEWLPKFTLVNARLTWRNKDRDLSVSLEATNLTNEYYYYAVFDSRPNNGIKGVSPARPREWAITVKKNF